MTIAAIASAPPAISIHARDHETQARRVLWQVTALILALIIPTTLGALFDGRLTNGVNGWAKPLKFETSLALHFATLAILLGLVEPSVRARRLIRWSILAAAVIAVLEIAYIMVQAGRARPSHFNNDTLLEEVAYALMGLGASTIVLATFIAGLMLWRYPRPGLSAAMRLAAGSGLMFSGLATLLIGGYMSVHSAHWVGAPTGAGGLPLVGWSTQGGDLRVPHFFATHAAQVVPLFALGWERLRRHDARRPVVVFLVVYTVFTLAVFGQAVLGLPFIRW